MKMFPTLITVAAALALAGCTSTSTPPLALDRVGPAPRMTPTQPSEGFLVVCPAWLPLTTLDDPDLSIRATYQIRSDDGALYRNIRTWGSEANPEPTSVPLPAGRYTVEARATGHGRVRVPVMIEPHRTTTVRLDGQPDSGFAHSAASDLVTLPDGTVVGWRAQ